VFFTNKHSCCGGGLQVITPAKAEKEMDSKTYLNLKDTKNLNSEMPQ
jgi:hypothetical protein